MHVNKWPVATAVGLLLMAVASIAFLHAAATPTVGPLAVNPAYIVVNTPTQVTFTISITDPSLIAGGVNLLQTDASGKTISTTGMMHDDALNGDAVAGDKTFSYRLPLNQPSVGQIYYRSSAALKGALQRALSNVVMVTVDPFKLPPDPGDAGKQTLKGIDLDHDGVRDDVQRYIALTYSSATTRQALTQYAFALQAAMETNVTPNSLVEQQIASVRCIAFIIGDTGDHAWTEASGALRALQLNTSERFRAYALVRQQADPNLLEDTTTTDAELGRYCK